MRDPVDIHPLLKGYEGRPAAAAARARDPVNAPMIRHWCEVMGDTNPAYTGSDAIAPPAMLQVWIMPGLGGPAHRSPAHRELFELLSTAGYTAIVATDCEQEYLRPLRPGDAIIYDTVIETVSPRKTTRLGTGYFITTRTDLRVDGECVGSHRFRVFRYAPAGTDPAGTAPARMPSDPAEGEGIRGEGARSEGTRREDGAQGDGVRSDGNARPLPVVNRDNAAFWEGVAARKLLIQRCDACATLRFPWLPGCGECGSPEWTAVEACGAGTVFSYVVVHHPALPAFDPPYAVGLIQLAEGVRMISNVVGVPHDRVRVGMSVELEFAQVGGTDGVNGEGSEDGVDGGRLLPVFRAREGRVS
ncbi:OB-fold domain-containing protein [Streptomyces sp. UNOC14_S4]|uniref:bifunctional MaoC family dehydratase N-terminal/OB-fold nucleic acid binding domain-containing protein n=1 Tax=Streptomyces sp. UNOC14_S4 TaxID=2872340 RepID=UPI001E598468|nr:OB-fold domain-containing protein [Streptomyces sp. UNOC14_S4]MCC3766846.1 OB-fold domain-containing protein [Streptomyces sp. UNOC14_S4]